MTTLDPDATFETPGREVKAFDSEGAAEEFAEYQFYRSDCPTEQEIAVVHPDGSEEVFDVETEMVPSFSATKRVKKELAP